MAAIRLEKLMNFFVTAEEIAKWIGEWVGNYELNYLFIQNYPMRMARGNDPAVACQIIATDHLFEEMFLGIQPLKWDAKNYSELREINPDHLGIHLPVRKSISLRAAALGSLTADSQALKCWKAIATNVMSRTESGMWMVNQITKAKAFYPKLRYTSGAAAEQETGTGLVTFAAESPVFVNEPDV